MGGVLVRVEPWTARTTVPVRPVMSGAVVLRRLLLGCLVRFVRRVFVRGGSGRRVRISGGRRGTRRGVRRRALSGGETRSEEGRPHADTGEERACYDGSSSGFLHASEPTSRSWEPAENHRITVTR